MNLDRIKIVKEGLVLLGSNGIIGDLIDHHGMIPPYHQSIEIPDIFYVTINIHQDGIKYYRTLCDDIPFLCMNQFDSGFYVVATLFNLIGKITNQ